MVEEIENSKCLKMLAYQLGDDREDVDRLYDYNPIFKKFGRSWIKKVERAENVFEKFIFLWFTFNSWLALAVSEKERNDEDVYLLHSIAASERFDKRFDDLFDRDKEFQNNAKEFTELGPIFRVIWLKNNNLDPWDPETERLTYVKELFKRNPFTYKKGNNYPQFSPSCALNHIDSDDKIPCDWLHTIHMIYQIRCNLFHGGKTYDSLKDEKFVELAFEILKPMLQPELENL